MRANWLCGRFCVQASSFENYIAEKAFTDRFVQQSPVTALGYAAWNIGIIKGNITILVTLSYFSPIFSSLISMFILQTNLSLSFWHGAILVTVGSLICWISTSWPQIKTKLQLLKSAH